ncbi:hypothetical protein T09_7051 [Trichinella sp. T9]|nr:hypothetical protein T09_7051 [Trichinella sp. T9]
MEKKEQKWRKRRASERMVDRLDRIVRWSTEDWSCDSQLCKGSRGAEGGYCTTIVHSKCGERMYNSELVPNGFPAGTTDLWSAGRRKEQATL